MSGTKVVQVALQREEEVAFRARVGAAIQAARSLARADGVVAEAEASFRLLRGEAKSLLPQRLAEYDRQRESYPAARAAAARLVEEVRTLATGGLDRRRVGAGESTIANATAAIDVVTRLASEIAGIAEDIRRELPEAVSARVREGARVERLRALAGAVISDGKARRGIAASASPEALAALDRALAHAAALEASPNPREDELDVVREKVEAAGERALESAVAAARRDEIADRYNEALTGAKLRCTLERRGEQGERIFRHEGSGSRVRVDARFAEEGQVQLHLEGDSERLTFDGPACSLGVSEIVDACRRVGIDVRGISWVDPDGTPTTLSIPGVSRHAPLADIGKYRARDGER